MESKQTIIVRRASLEDKEAHVRLRYALWPETPLEQQAAEIDELHALGHAAYLAETTDGKVVGFAEVSIHYFVEGCDSRNLGYLEGWFVSEEYRRRGIGRQLVAAAETWAHEKGALEMASACEWDNATSEVAHKSLGYEEVLRSITFRVRLPNIGGEKRE